VTVGPNSVLKRPGSFHIKSLGAPDLSQGMDCGRLVGLSDKWNRCLGTCPVQRAYWNSSGKSSFRTSFKPLPSTIT